MKEEITLTKEEILVDFINDALNFYWHDANRNLERKDLGDIERKNYEKQLSKAEFLMSKASICVKTKQ